MRYISEMEKIKLTQTVQKGGCAAKVPALALREILSNIQFPKKHPELLVDGEYFDDAAIYQVSEDKALVQTLDFFTPIVDSPKLFGMIAATNALSDVYAMGGKPITAMAIFAFPLATLDQPIASEILQGASDIIAKSKACFVGGHSIDDETIKFGLSVTGLVHPQKIWANKTAKAGDVLILTKAIGTGTLCAGLKRGHWNEDQISEAIQSMCTLNNVIDFLNADELNAIHAATDITGFGLSGHCYQMSKASHLGIEIQFKQLPILDKALESIEMGHLTKAHRTNQEYTHEKIQINSRMTENEKKLLHDPQTSGGLLLAVDPAMAQTILEKLKVHFPRVSIVGGLFNLRETDGHNIIVE